MFWISDKHFAGRSAQRCSFFPILNISTLLFFVPAGKVIYKEKMSRREVLILLIGIVAILLITA